MKQPIIGFKQDLLGDWVAELDCGHQQHVRHAPPFQDRAWVLSETGRSHFIGHTLDCQACDAIQETNDATSLSS